MKSATQNRALLLRTALLMTCCSALICLTAFLSPSLVRAADTKPTDTLGPCMEKAKSIKVGQSRKEIDQKLFQEGGLTSGRGLTFFVRECRQPDGQVVKLDITFSSKAEKGGAEDSSAADPEQQVVTVSEPYMGLPVAD